MLPEIKITEAPPESVPLQLLLAADPSEARVCSYLRQSRCFVAMADGAMAGACLVLQLALDAYELMNIAVAADWQRRGVGTALLQYAVAAVRSWDARRLDVCTGTFGHQAAWYQRAGFRVVAVERDYFLRAYAEPVWEGGRQHKDMLRLAIEF